MSPGPREEGERKATGQLGRELVQEWETEGKRMKKRGHSANSKGKIWGEGRGQTCSSGQYCQLTKELWGRLPSGLNLGLAPQ